MIDRPFIDSSLPEWPEIGPIHRLAVLVYSSTQSMALKAWSTVQLPPPGCLES